MDSIRVGFHFPIFKFCTMLYLPFFSLFRPLVFHFFLYNIYLAKRGKIIIPLVLSFLSYSFFFFRRLVDNENKRVEEKKRKDVVTKKKGKEQKGEGDKPERMRR